MNSNLEEKTIYGLEIEQPPDLKPRKRLRICLRCQKTMPDKTRCENCRINFRDGLAMRLLKKVLGIKLK